MSENKFWVEGADKSEKDNAKDKRKNKENDKNQEENKDTKGAPEKKINIDGKKVRDGLAQLILTVVELLRDLMERQAIARIENGSLDDEQIERLGSTFKSLKTEVEKLKDYFEFEDEDLNLDLGPLGQLRDTGDTFEISRASAVDLLDRVLKKGVLVKGDVIISVADVDLISLNLGILLASIEKAREITGTDLRAERLEAELKMLQDELKNHGIRRNSNKKFE